MISFDENELKCIVFEHDRWSQGTKTHSFGDKLLELCHSFEITVLNGLFDRKGGKFAYVSHSGSCVVDYFALSDEVMDRKPVLSIA